MEDLTKFLNITYNNVRPQRGKVLISQPLMSDGCFRRAVVLITDYSKKGTVGLILNKWLQLALDDDVMEDFQLSIGGPVQADTIHYLHTVDNIPGAIEIAKGLYWGGDYEIVRKMLSISVMKPANTRFFIGYSGWTAGQLDEELKSHSWIVGDVLPSQIIQPSHNLWQDTVKNMGEKYQQWTNFPENPCFN